MANEGIAEFKVLEPSKLLSDLLKHIETTLPSFANSNTFHKITVKKKFEKQNSTAFSVFMMNGQDQFTFMNEVAQQGAHSIDIAVYDKSSSEIIFTIEAKILPTPPGNKKNPRAESEYVYSNPGEAGAGIERFKNGVHGLNDENKLLPESGMLGYIKKEDFPFWFSKINKWISDAGWQESEQLVVGYFNSIGRLKSNHQRIGKSEVVLHHFWIYVSVEAPVKLTT